MGRAREIRLGPQDVLNIALGDAGPDAVAQQHKAFAKPEFAVEIIHHQVLVQPHRTLEHVLHAGLFPDMVFAQPLQLAIQPTVGATIANMGEGEMAPAQYKRGQRGQQRQPAAIGL